MIFMAGKGKAIPYVLTGKQTGRILGSGRATKDKIKVMNEKGIQKYSHSLKAREVVAVKPVKKGGTKALLNAK